MIYRDSFWLDFTLVYINLILDNYPSSYVRFILCPSYIVVRFIVVRFIPCPF